MNRPNREREKVEVDQNMTCNGPHGEEFTGEDDQAMEDFRSTMEKTMKSSDEQ